MKKILRLSLLVLLLGSASAKDHEVKMLDIDLKGQTMVFEPGVLHIEVGDSVTFIPTHKSHWAKSVIVPEGAEKFESKLDEKATFRFDTEGVYIYECPPHRIMSMVGIIQVGKAVNKAKINEIVPKLERRVLNNQGRLSEYAKQIR